MNRILLLSIFCCLSTLFCFSQENVPIANKFLLVLDIQNYYTINKLPDSSSQKFIDSVNYIISNISPGNVIYIKSTHKVLNLSLSSPFIYVSLDTSAMYLDKRMNLVNEQIFTKEEPNAFSIKALNDFLKQNNAKEIFIIGLLAEQCVYESSIAGKELGYDMYVIPGAIMGKSLKSKEKVIKKLKVKGIKTADINYAE